MFLVRLVQTLLVAKPTLNCCEVIYPLYRAAEIFIFDYKALPKTLLV